MLIEHFARWVISTYERLLEWAGTIRSAGVPEQFERAVDLAAQAADTPIGQIREFIDELVRQLEKIPTDTASADAEKESLIIESTLTLSVDNELMAKAIDELRRAIAQED